MSKHWRGSQQAIHEGIEDTFDEVMRDLWSRHHAPGLHNPDSGTLTDEQRLEDEYYRQLSKQEGQKSKPIGKTIT